MTLADDGQQVGDNVAVMPLIYDGTCNSCVAGAMNTCSQAGFYGIHSKTGGLSDGAVIPEELVFKLPKSIDLDIGGMSTAQLICQRS